ncbi:MAG: hypothetical protein AB7V14_03085 [Kiritimatiellia bacterium]
MTLNRTMIVGLAACFVWMFALAPGGQAWAQEDAAVHLMLKNNSGASVDVGLVDQYGGNFTASIDAGTSQNQTLQAQSEIKIGETVVHVVVPADEGAEIVVAE